MSSQNNDVFETLGWGLRKYAWVVALFVLALGILVPTLLSRTPDQFETKAQVGPTNVIRLPNLDALPRTGEEVFSNGAVAEAVRQSVEPRIPRSVSVVPERVELVAAQDSIVFTVIGRGNTPRQAQNAANVAAAAFTQELNKYAQPVASFDLKSIAIRPIQAVPRIGGVISIVIGILAGLIGGIGVVGLLLAWRRPVIDARGAEEAAEVPVFGRVTFGSSSDRSRGISPLARRITSGGFTHLLLVGPANTRRHRRLLADQLTGALDNVRVADGRSEGIRAAESDRSATLLVVREGTSHSTMRREAAEHVGAGSTAVVLVRESLRRPRWLRRRREPDPTRSPSTDDKSDQQDETDEPLPPPIWAPSDSGAVSTSRR